MKYTPSAPQWWITGFNPEYQDVNYKNLRVEGMIDFSKEPELWDAFVDKYGDKTELYGICIDEKNKTIYYRW